MYKLGGISILAIVYVMRINKLFQKIKAEDEKKEPLKKDEKFEKVVAVNDDENENKSS